VGVRVVVRRVLPGQTGPTGGPAMTDLLGVLEEWGTSTITVRGEDGTPVVIDRALVVSGKPVPPRPSVRHRLGADEVAVRSADVWPALEVERIGDWLLRASSGFSRRANSALLAGDPGVPWPEALDRVEAFYRSRGLPPQVQAVGGSVAAERLVAEGWAPAGPGADVAVQLAGVAQALRAVRREGGSAGVELTSRVSDGWLASDTRALAHREAAVAVLEGPGQVTFAAVTGSSGAVVAKGRAALSERADVWAGITDVWVEPAERRRGLARAVMGALLSWSAERGASTAFLQTTQDNQPALALYEQLGFLTHHTYRYLRLPACPADWLTG
jgi:ribosomal protein S18 acetylase RimI-like enzyme